MKKIQLDVDALEVQSFATSDGAKEHGTVRGHSGICANTIEECESLTDGWGCECVDTEPGQFSCNYLCETRDCP